MAPNMLDEVGAGVGSMAAPDPGACPRLLASLGALIQVLFDVTLYDINKLEAACSIGNAYEEVFAVIAALAAGAPFAGVVDSRAAATGTTSRAGSGAGRGRRGSRRLVIVAGVLHSRIKSILGA
jgi:hypothetical protein